MATKVLSGLMVLLGLWIAGRALVTGDGGWFGVVIGLLFVAAGSGRLYLERQR
jgi:hypothetical protein